MYGYPMSRAYPRMAQAYPMVRGERLALSQVPTADILRTAASAPATPIADILRSAAPTDAGAIATSPVTDLSIPPWQLNVSTPLGATVAAAAPAGVSGLSGWTWYLLIGGALYGLYLGTRRPRPRGRRQR